MQRKIRALICGVALTLSGFAALGVSAPAHACTGDVCDSFCDSINQLNQKLPPKLKLTNCELG